MPLIIGLVGFIGSGKGTVGDLLRDQYGYIQDSFAAPLKDAVSAIFGWDRVMLEGNTPESRAWREVPDEFWSKEFKKPFTPRAALQLMGTEAGRDVFHPNLWVASCLKRCAQRERAHTVITDVRFKNEFRAIQDVSGIIVRIRRGPEPPWYDTAIAVNQHLLNPTEMTGVHQSEWDWVGLPVNHTIYNDGSLADLRDAVRNVAVMPQMFLTFP